MSAEGQIVEVWAGDDTTVHVDVADGDGNAKDLTNASAITFKVARRRGDTAEFDKTLGSGITNLTATTTGRIAVAIDSADTSGLDGIYFMEARVTDADSDQVTVTQGRFWVHPVQG